MKLDDINIKTIETLLGQIIDKSSVIKAKNNNDIEQINTDFNKFLDLGRNLIQTCISDKISLIKELDTLQTTCKDLNYLINSSSKNCTKCPSKYKPHMKLENLFENSSDLDDNLKNDNKFIKEEKIEKQQEICIPDTCQPDTCFSDHIEIVKTKQTSTNQNKIIKETVDIDLESHNNKDLNKIFEFKNLKFDKFKLNEQSTPKAIKKLLNEHGLEDLTNSPTVIDKDLAETNKILNKNANKTETDKYDNLIEKILKNESFEKSTNLNDSFDYSLDFKKAAVTTNIPQQQNNNKLKKLKSNEKLINNQQTSPIVQNKKRFKQITMTQAFDNYRYNNNSQSKENLPTTATTTTTILSSTNSSSKLNIATKFNRENMNQNNNNRYLDQDVDLVLLDTNDDKKRNNKLNRLNSTSSNLNDDNEIDNNNNNNNDDDDDDDDLIFNFDKPPKKKTNSPNYKHVQVVKKQNERKKLNAFTCKECENYWKSLPEELRLTRMQDICRHRAKYEAPATPEDYWSIRFPNTQECIEKGYGGVVVEPDVEGPKRARRKRPLKLIQRNSDEENDFS